MDIQRLRNLTTRKLHTESEDFVKDLEMLVGDSRIQIQMISRIMYAIEPWLREKVTDERFWNGKYDPTHVGDYPLPTPSKDDKDNFFARFSAMPNPLKEK